MAVAESLEGSVGSLWFQYDIRNDVLYLRLLTRRDDEAHGEEMDDGYILLRAMDDDAPVGITIVNWWKRFGRNELPDSVTQILARIEPWAERLDHAA